MLASTALKELSARFINTELEVAFRLLLVAENAYAQGDLETYNAAVLRARESCEWIARFIERVPEQERAPVQARFADLQSAVERFDLTAVIV